MAETYASATRKYLVQGDPQELVEFSDRVMMRITRDGWVICACDANFEFNMLILGAIPWFQHPNAALFWLRGLDLPYEQVPYDLQPVLDSAANV